MKALSRDLHSICPLLFLDVSSPLSIFSFCFVLRNVVCSSSWPSTYYTADLEHPAFTSQMLASQAVLVYAVPGLKPKAS